MAISPLGAHWVSYCHCLSLRQFSQNEFPQHRAKTCFTEGIYCRVLGDRALGFGSLNPGFSYYSNRAQPLLSHL